MTLHHEYQPEVFRPWYGEPINGVSHPLDIEQLWSAEELAAIDLYVAADAEPIPADKMAVSTDVQRVAGVVRYVHILEDAPHSVPARITPLQARKALRTLGYKAGVDAYVASLPEEQAEEWEYATEIWRSNAVIAAGIAAGVLTAAQVDEVFVLGATL